MNPELDRLHPYPFERLARLKQGVAPPPGLAPIGMSIGEPQHEPPSFVVDVLRENAHRLGSYPATAGLPELRAAAARWLERRFRLPLHSVAGQSMVLPVNGTREALFAFVQAAVDRQREPLIVMPNPLYQIYEGAAQLAGAQPYFLDASPAQGFLPDLACVPAAIWRRCQILLLCSPGNPTGANLTPALLRTALELAERYAFLVAVDECYCEIYFDEAQPPAGLLQAALASGRGRFERCIVFHSLSKRSSVPGLRSGFVAGDPQVLSRFLLYRTYHGSAMPLTTQLASIAAWNDDAHAAANRRLYQQKLAGVLPILAPVMAVPHPQGAFFLWPEVGVADDERWSLELFAQQNVSVLPGSYLGRPSPTGAGLNPGVGRVRISLVPQLASCLEAARRIRQFMQSRSEAT